MQDLVQHITENFKTAGYAEWIDNKGLQVDSSCVDSDKSGVYVMIDSCDNIQKVGKSSASLKQRLNGYKSFDQSLQRVLDRNANGEKIRIDESSVRQRNSIKENGLNGLFVYFLEADNISTTVAGFQTTTPSFDAHALEALLTSKAKDLGHPLSFGS